MTARKTSGRRRKRPVARSPLAPKGTKAKGTGGGKARGKGRGLARPVAGLQGTIQPLELGADGGSLKLKDR